MDELSDLKLRKKKAIDDLDFELAEEIEEMIHLKENTIADLQAKQISDEIISEFKVLNIKYNQKIEEIKNTFEANQKDIIEKFENIYTETQKRQIDELSHLESQRENEIHEESLKTNSQTDLLLQESKKQTFLGNFKAAETLKNEANQVLEDDLRIRCREINEVYDEEKNDLLEKHKIEANDIMVLKQKELEENQNERDEKIDKAEKFYKASILSLKSKCSVRCRVLPGNQEVNEKHSLSIIRHIESLEKQINVEKQKQERIKTSHNLRENALARTRYLMNQNKTQYLDDPATYMRRTATAVIQRNPRNQPRFLTSSFFTTQNTG